MLVLDFRGPVETRSHSNGSGSRKPKEAMRGSVAIAIVLQLGVSMSAGSPTTGCIFCGLACGLEFFNPSKRAQRLCGPTSKIKKLLVLIVFLVF